MQQNTTFGPVAVQRTEQLLRDVSGDGKFGTVLVFPKKELSAKTMIITPLEAITLLQDQQIDIMLISARGPDIGWTALYVDRSKMLAIYPEDATQALA